MHGPGGRSIKITAGESGLSSGDTVSLSQQLMIIMFLVRLRVGDKGQIKKEIPPSPSTNQALGSHSFPEQHCENWCYHPIFRNKSTQRVS
jgi:hypothetical protein